MIICTSTFINSLFIVLVGWIYIKSDIFILVNNNYTNNFKFTYKKK